MRSILATVLCLSCVSGYCSESSEASSTHGAYIGGGYSADIRSDAAYPARGSIFGGYQLSNGIRLEYRHTSAIGSDDGVDLDSDNENDITTSENSIGVYYVHWFK